MPRTSKTSKKGQKSSGTPAKAAASSNGANTGSPSVSTRQNEATVNGVASQSPSETKVMGARMSGVKHSGLLAKDGEERLVLSWRFMLATTLYLARVCVCV